MSHNSILTLNDATLDSLRSAAIKLGLRCLGPGRTVGYYDRNSVEAVERFELEGCKYTLGVVEANGKLSLVGDEYGWMGRSLSDVCGHGFSTLKYEAGVEGGRNSMSAGGFSDIVETVNELGEKELLGTLFQG